MNRQTGHFTARTSGDYFITFTANLVSVNSQAIWCALYKQSSGKEGWEVLGEKLIETKSRKNIGGGENNFEKYQLLQKKTYISLIKLFLFSNSRERTL